MLQALLFFINRTPFFFPFLGLFLGILIAEYLPPTPITKILPASAGLLLLALFFFFPQRKKFQWQHLLPFAYLLFFITAGQLLLIQKNVRQQKNWIGKLDLAFPASALELIIETTPVEKLQATQVVAKVVTLHRGKTPQPATGKILLTSYQKEVLAALLPGNKILLLKAPTLLVHTGNPGERNWATYFARQQITHRCTVKIDDFILLDSSPRNYVFTRLLSRLQQKIVSLLDSTIQDPQSAGLAAALLIGYRQHLDPTLQESYSKTGVVHIIAISGMHLALLGWLLQFFVGPFEKNKIGRWLSQLLIIPIIWLFTCLAGATPSVLRAALAFTIASTGKMLGRKPSSLNTLAAAGFLLLVIQPYWLWDLGFQLSFIAVLSILLFAKPLQEILPTPYRLIKLMTTLISVTLAAQFLTTPFTLFYFQQFPLGFLLSNLIAVPLSSCILYVLLFLMITANIPYLNRAMGMLAEKLILWMNQYIQSISEIPGIQLDKLHWTWGEAVLLLGILCTGAGWVLLKSKSGAIITGCLGCFLIALQCGDIFFHQQQEALVIYQSKSGSMISWIKGNHALHLLDSTARTSEMKKNGLVVASNRFYRVQQQMDTLLTPYFQIGKWTVIVPHRKFEPPVPATTGSETILLVTRTAAYDGESWIQHNTISIAILDGTLGARTRENWKKLLLAHGIPVHDMLTNGAFVYSPPSSTFALLSTLHTP
ncbi:MAG: ComEC family competence protein [Bacteroidetes bacterium]|nr:ComEC family competence protein [Bacteroidota bacterium]